MTLYTLYLQFKRGRDESGDSDDSDGSDNSDKEDDTSRQSQHSHHLPDTSSTSNASRSINSGKSGKSGKSGMSGKSGKTKAHAKGNRCEEAPNPSVQLVTDSNRFQARILDIMQNMRPTMDPQRQGMMDYTAGVVRKLNEEEWDDFEDQVFPIVRQFAARRVIMFISLLHL